MIDTLFLPGLGELSLLPGSPPGQRFWCGEFSYKDQGQQRSVYHLCCEQQDFPEEPQRQLACLVLASVARFIEAALVFLAARLAQEPGFFGVSAAQADQLLSGSLVTLPFGRPELTFYTDGTWLLRFAEGSLPVCDPHGIGVFFQGETPCSIEDLSSSEHDR